MVDERAGDAGKLLVPELQALVVEDRSFEESERMLVSPRAPAHDDRPMAASRTSVDAIRTTARQLKHKPTEVSVTRR